MTVGIEEVKNTQRVIKKFEDWKNCSFYDFLNVGDYVDERFVDYFLEVIYPRTWTRTIIQMGEPYSHINGKATYATLSKDEFGWKFCGNCHIYETENMGM